LLDRQRGHLTSEAFGGWHSGKRDIHFARGEGVTIGVMVGVSVINLDSERGGKNAIVNVEVNPVYGVVVLRSKGLTFPNFIGYLNEGVTTGGIALRHIN